jgi:hypothetical protein
MLITNRVLECFSLLEVSAAMYCCNDKESSLISGDKQVLLLVCKNKET